MENTNCPLGFDENEDVEDFLERGQEIRFAHEGETYEIDGLGIRKAGEWDYLVDGEDLGVSGFLDMKWKGKTVREILNESKITHIH